MTTAIYFSATDTTERITEAVASCSAEAVASLNLTQKGSPRSFAASDTVVVGVPVYAGRVPEVAAGRLAALEGNGARCIALVVYGNRDYDDALLELCDILSSKGFNIVSAGAFIAEHCIFPEVSAGRPDKEDMESVNKFGELSFAKTYALDLSEVKGNRPYKAASKVSLHPSVDEQLCNACGECAKQCPTSAISISNPRNTDNDKCITCCRCIHICPSGARRFAGTSYTLAAQKFTKANAIRRNPEWFI